MKKITRLALFLTIAMLGLHTGFACGMAGDSQPQYQNQQQQNNNQPQVQAQPSGGLGFLLGDSFMYNHCRLHWQRATGMQQAGIVLATVLGSYAFYKMFPRVASVTESIFSFGMRLMQCNQLFNWAFGS